MYEIEIEVPHSYIYIYLIFPNIHELKDGWVINWMMNQIVRHWEDGGVQIPIGFFLVSVGARPRGAKCFLTRKNGVGNQKICKIYPGDSAGDFFGMVKYVTLLRGYISDLQLTSGMKLGHELFESPGRNDLRK